MFPNSYQSFTEDNFIVETGSWAKIINEDSTISRMAGNDTRIITSEVTKTYNKDTGILTLLSPCVKDTAKGYIHGYTQCTIKKVYLVN